MNPVLQIVLGSAATALMTWAGIELRRVRRVLSALEDFPPHRHIGGEVVYPRGLEPRRPEHLDTRGAPA